LRKQGVLPATVYGKHLAPIAVQTEMRSFAPLMRQAGRTNLVNLHIEGEAEPIQAFVHSYQRHPVSRAIIHVDFHAVSMSETVDVELRVHLVGVSPLVHRGDAMYNQGGNIKVRALPGNIPTHVEVDVSVLDSAEKSIVVRDIVLPAGVTLLSPEEDLVVNLVTTRRGATSEGA
jgi:large subunit ribosomal protein L25